MKEVVVLLWWVMENSGRFAFSKASSFCNHRKSHILSRHSDWWSVLVRKLVTTYWMLVPAEDHTWYAIPTACRLGIIRVAFSNTSEEHHLEENWHSSVGSESASQHWGHASILSGLLRSPRHGESSLFLAFANATSTVIKRLSCAPGQPFVCKLERKMKLGRPTLEKCSNC